MSEIKAARADDGKTIELRSGDTLRIELEENPTTGHRWAAEESDDRVLLLQKDDYVLEEHPAIGQGGTRVLVFEARAVGATSVRLKHWREWEGDASIIDRLGIEIVVR